MNYLASFHPSLVVGVAGVMLLGAIMMVEQYRLRRNPVWQHIRKHH